MRYFGYEAIATTTDAGAASYSTPEPLRNDSSRLQVLVFLDSIIQKISRPLSCKDLYENSIFHGGLLDLLIKVWLKTEDGDSLSTVPSFHAGYNTCWLPHVNSALGVVYSDDDDSNRMDHVREMLFREEGGDARLVTKRLLHQLKHPAKADKERARLMESSLTTIFYISVKSTSVLVNEQTDFMDIFLKHNIVPLTMQVLSFVVDDMARPRSLQVVDENSFTVLVQTSLIVLQGCEQSINGMHWAMVMLKLGFLRVAASLVAPPTYLGPNSLTALHLILTRDIPEYLCQRFVLIPAIKAVKDLTFEGLTKNFESSDLKESWTIFENVLLERTVFNAIYERDFAEEDIDQCFSVCYSLTA